MNNGTKWSSLVAVWREDVVSAVSTLIHSNFIREHLEAGTARRTERCPGANRENFRVDP